MAFDVFISHSSRDKTAADATCAVLEAASVRCWIAPRDIRAGTEYGAAIIDAIDHCRVMVLVFSSSANESNQIRREIERAVVKGIPVLPVRIEEVVPTQSLEYFLSGIHWLDALKPPLEQHLLRLAETIKAMLVIDTRSQAGAKADEEHKQHNSTEAPGRATGLGPTEPRAAFRVDANKTPQRSWLLPAICAAMAVILFGGGLWLYQHGMPALKSTASTSSTPVQAVPATFRGIAQSRNFLIGADSSISPLRNDVFYAQTLAHEYNFVGTGAETWWARVQKSRTEADFSNVDAIVEFATANGMKVRGTALVSGDVPAWLSKANLSPAENSAIFKDFVQTMLRRYRGRVYSWDISWGTFDNLGKPRETFWTKNIGQDYVEQVVAWSREADPQAKLFIHNNYDTGPLAPRSESTYNLLRNFRARGVPVDGVALATHLLLDQLPNMQEEITNINRLAALGLEMHMVEFEVSAQTPPTAQDLKRQAVVYADYLTECLSIQNCSAFMIGGVSDKDAYAPNRWPGMGVGAAMPFDANFKPKPAYTAILDALSGVRSAKR